MANPYHDDKGKFSSGSGSGPAGDKPERTSDTRAENPATSRSTPTPGTPEAATQNANDTTARQLRLRLEKTPTGDPAAIASYEERKSLALQEARALMQNGMKAGDMKKAIARQFGSAMVAQLGPRLNTSNLVKRKGYTGLG